MADITTRWIRACAVDDFDDSPHQAEFDLRTGRPTLPAGYGDPS